MSKSIGGTGTLWVLDDPKTLTKKVKSAVTDTGREVRADRRQARHHQPADDPVGRAPARPSPELEAAYDGKGYGDFKADVAEAVVELFAPVRERYAELMADPAELDARARRRRRAGRARSPARRWPTVRERVGLLAPPAERGADGPPRLRRRHRPARAVHQRAAGLARAARRPERRRHPAARHAAAADRAARGGARRGRGAPARGRRGASSRSRCTCAASATFRPVSPVVFVPLVAGASPTASGSRARCAPGR